MRHTRLPTISLAIALLGVLGAPISCNRSSAPAPTEPFVSAATAREPCTCLFVGGDARDDRSHVVQWALRKAREQNACAFVFLGDMELNPQLDVHFQKELAELGQIPFYPVLGNHEVKLFGIFGIDRKEHVEKFKRRFLDNVHTPIKSELRDRVAYSVDLSGGVHFVALDNVAEPGFGRIRRLRSLFFARVVSISSSRVTFIRGFLMSRAASGRTSPGASALPSHARRRAGPIDAITSSGWTSPIAHST